VYDCVVVGAGYAGICAARDLSDRGRSVVVLEARDRVGGRMHRRPFQGRTDVYIEEGGAYVDPSLQPHIRRETERYRISLSQVDNSTGEVRFRTAGARRRIPVPVEELACLERAWVHTAQAARRINPALPFSAQTVGDLDVSIGDFFGPLELPPATLDLLCGLIGGYGAAVPEQISMLQVLGWIAGCKSSPFGAFVGVFDTKFTNGTGELIRAMIADAGLAIELNTPVSAVDATDGTVRVVTASGGVWDGATCIVAIPSNCFGDIAITGISEHKRQVIGELHGSLGAKAFFIVENAPAGFVGISGQGDAETRGLRWLFDDQALDEGSRLMVGFSSSEVFNAVSVYDADLAVKAFLPDAVVRAVDLHNWTDDPYSRGLFRVHPPGTGRDYARRVNERDGRIVFAGSDVAEDIWAGAFMEGALQSGTAAAHTISTLLD
jgi:monoamine oxidase